MQSGTLFYQLISIHTIQKNLNTYNKTVKKQGRIGGRQKRPFIFDIEGIGDERTAIMEGTDGRLFPFLIGDNYHRSITRILLLKMGVFGKR